MANPNTNITINKNDPRYTQWWNVFHNFQLCKSCWNKMGFYDKNVIPVPIDTEEREYACAAARDTIAQLKDNTNYSKTGDVKSNENLWCVTTANQFLRAASTYIQRLGKQQQKETEKYMRANKGAGAYSIDQVAPKTNSLQECLNTGTAAGKQAAVLYMTQGPEAVTQFQHTVAQYFKDDRYASAFYMTFAMALADEKSLAEAGTKRSKYDDDVETHRRQLIAKNRDRYKSYLDMSNNAKNATTTREADIKKANTYQTVGD